MTPGAPRKLQAIMPSPRGRAAAGGAWRWPHLLWAPHRLAFFTAVLLLIAASLWWAAVQVDRFTGALGLGYAVSPSLTHAAVMTLGFLPLFFTGFLFTAGPKWLGVSAPEARELLPAVLLQGLGWLVWLVGAHTLAALAVAGLLLALAGQLWQNARFWALVRNSAVDDRLHARVVAVAGSVGVLCLAGVALTQALQLPDLARHFVLSGLWGFIVPTYLAVAHRMIPFFTSSAVPMVNAWRPFWVLGFLIGTAALQLGVVWLEAAGLGHPVLRGLLGLAELLAGAVVIWLSAAWGLVQSLKIRLLAMLHLGFVWLGLALLIAGAARWLGLVAGSPVLGLGALHALTMGFLGSTLLAMVTRVACGHSGRTLVADGLVWALFWLLQIAVLLRVTGSLVAAPVWVLPVSALLFAAVVLAWGGRLVRWLGQPRVDGRPG